MQKIRILKPSYFTVSADGPLFAQFKYQTIIVNGTWSVEIDGLVYLPGDTLPEAVIGEGEGIEHEYQIRFLEDLSSDPSVSFNRRLKSGKFLHVRKTK